MKKFEIAMIPGDGVGHEVMAEARKILEKLSQLHSGVRFVFTDYDWGCDYYIKNGKMMDSDGLSRLSNHDAILLGAVGFPGVPDHISLWELLLKIRKGFDQYINLRPVKLLRGVVSPLRDMSESDLDMVFVRENIEGEYSGKGGIYREGTKAEYAEQISLFTRENSERVMDFAFNLARERKCINKVTSITKSNALNYSMVFWDKIFKERKKGFPDIGTESLHVDAAAMFMVQNPKKFDVVVASNLFGDILTDLGAALQGGLGFAAGANLNPEKKYPSMFEPVHGSAPDIAGKNIANPVAMIWSVKLMLDFLGLDREAELVMRSIEKFTSLNFKENLTTSGTGDLICSAMEQNV